MSEEELRATTRMEEEKEGHAAAVAAAAHNASKSADASSVVLTGGGVRADVQTAGDSATAEVCVFVCVHTRVLCVDIVFITGEIVDPGSRTMIGTLVAAPMNSSPVYVP